MLMSMMQIKYHFHYTVTFVSGQWMLVIYMHGHLQCANGTAWVEVHP